ncbi:MAG: sensor histidine kinase [Clostridia bacterium]|nr:sensor histidine kinase [Clostridia bacterium]
MKKEKKSGGHFLRILGKYDIRNEQQLAYFGKWLIFIILVLVEAFIVLECIGNFQELGGWRTFLAVLIIEVVLTTAEALKFFVVPQGKIRQAIYVMDAIAAFGITFVASGAYPLVIYVLVLTSFYFDTEHVRPAAIILICASLLYVAGHMVQSYVISDSATLIDVLTRTFSSLVALVVHFLIVQVAFSFYRQFLRLDKTLKELDESKKELEKAYAVVAEVTALEERQRIAKEIHDTAGHSLTTVIMQTEMAKRIVEENPAEAKQKIIAANLQAKHALEELRDSVHLLSGNTANKTLKTALEDIIHESTDGTEINIRSSIEDVAVSSAKARFLCNSLKEGISNGLRHGNATAFWFELKQEDAKLRFLLSDNGKGVPVSALKIGFGLSSMQSRAKTLGGEVYFRSEEEDGFELEMILPVEG